MYLGDKINMQTLLIIISVLCFNLVLCRKYTKQDIRNLREEVREMFQHAYNGYLTYASDFDELRPLSCDGVNTWGSYSLTLIDALDTLAVMGNYTEFQRVAKLLTEKINFDSDINVSVFETNIRIVGGLISAHLMSHTAGADLEPGWPCNGPLLRMAEDVAKRLLPAFDSETGMPYGTVNLRHGVPIGETSVSCTACVGTFIVEFGALSRLTGDPIYEEVALNAIHALYSFKSPIGLYGNHVDVQNGRWTAQDAGIGAGVDSYYEYLMKGAIMLNRPELMQIFNEGKIAIDKYLKRDDWHVWVGMNKGQVTLPVFQSLEAYWPGVLSLFGDTVPAMKILHNYHTVWKQYGFLPEFYNIPNAEAAANREDYPLRPELIESVMYLYRATRDPYLLEIGEDFLRSIQHSAKTPCGYATVKNVRDHRIEDRMESFFLAETTKYLYLLFDPDNIINNDGGIGTVIDTPNGECIIETGAYIFSTEAHPIDMGALNCCYDLPATSFLTNYDRNKFAGDVIQFANYEADEQADVPVEMHNVTVNIQTKIDPEETRKNIVAEIMKVLKDNKKNRENVEEPLNADLNDKMDKNDDVTVEAQDDSIILPVDRNTIDIANESESEPINDDEIMGEVVEVIKLPPPARDSDDNKSTVQQSSTTTTAANEFPYYKDDTTERTSSSNAGISSEIDNSSVKLSKPASSYFNQEKYLEENLANTTNRSMITEFVHSVLKSTLPTKPKFNSQILLEKIRRFNANRNISQSYELLTCKAQPYLQRMSVLGEFF